MKVSEAKEKVCPFMSTSGINHVLLETLCVCGNCMAWEYTKIYSTRTQKDIFVAPDGWEFVEYNKKHNMVCKKELPEHEKEGYCKRLDTK